PFVVVKDDLGEMGQLLFLRVSGLLGTAALLAHLLAGLLPASRAVEQFLRVEAENQAEDDQQHAAAAADGQAGLHVFATTILDIFAFFAPFGLHDRLP